MFRLLIGLALLPSSLITLFVAAQALGALAAKTSSALPFVAGIGTSILMWLFARYAQVGPSGPAAWASRLVRTLYVFGHEFTHVLAAWTVGAKVHDFQVGEDGGHVDLSHSNFFIALAPYCVPVYTFAVVAGYRLLLWLKPGGGQTAFLALMGLTLAFHVLLTFECLWDRKQPDLAAAGGRVFSLSVIALANGLLVLLLLKALFPLAATLSEPLRRIAALSAAFWTWNYAQARALLAPIRARYPL